MTAAGIRMRTASVTSLLARPGFDLPLVRATASWGRTTTCLSPGSFLKSSAHPHLGDIFADSGDDIRDKTTFTDLRR